MRCSASPMVHYIDIEDRRRITREHRFKSAEEMAALFADLPEALANSIEIAQRCAFRPKRHAPILPQFVPESGLATDQELRVQAEAGLEKTARRTWAVCRRERPIVIA